MGTEDHHYLLQMPPALYSRLKAESDRTGAPMAVIMRRILDAHLPKSKKIRRVVKGNRDAS